MKKVVLYRCEARPCCGQVGFGSFPSTSANLKFGLLPGKRGRAERVEVNRDSIGRWFETLWEG